jgi:hypothetical protein
MNNQDIQTELIYFFFVAFLFLFIIGIIFRIFSKRFQFNKRNVELYGLLMNMNNTSLISISAITIQYLFVVFCTISFHGMNIIYLSIILILVLISEVVIDHFKGLPVSILIALINCGAIHIVYLLYDYITYEEFSYLLLIVLFLVILFIFLYDTYNLFRGINNVVVKNKYLKNKKYTL